MSGSGGHVAVKAGLTNGGRTQGELCLAETSNVLQVAKVGRVRGAGKQQGSGERRGEGTEAFLLRWASKPDSGCDVLKGPAVILVTLDAGDEARKFNDGVLEGVFVPQNRDSAEKQ